MNVRMIIFGINTAASLYWVANDFAKKYKAHKKGEELYPSPTNRAI